MLDHQLPELLAKRLQSPLPGSAAQRDMETELSYGRHFGPPRPDARPAAVVIFLHPYDDQWHLPLMLRPVALVNHPGQISLPGGTIEPGESSEEAALREMEEELGVPRHGALLLGQLSNIYVFASNFIVTPWVAAARSDIQFEPSIDEVDEVLNIPLDHLLDPASRGQHIYERNGVSVLAPHFAWRGHFVWGTTAMILAELAALI